VKSEQRVVNKAHSSAVIGYGVALLHTSHKAPSSCTPYLTGGGGGVRGTVAQQLLGGIHENKWPKSRNTTSKTTISCPAILPKTPQSTTGIKLKTKSAAVLQRSNQRSWRSTQSQVGFENEPGVREGQ
jgi:hypothetical protein